MASNFKQKYLFKDMMPVFRCEDLNLATALACGVDPTTFLNLKPKGYLKLVFKSILSRLNYVEIYEVLDEAVMELSNESYEPKKYSKHAGQLTLALREAVDIIELAESYGIVVNKKGKRKMAICPFHADTNPSLEFFPQTSSFYCYGCKATGDVIEFFRRMSFDE